MLLHDGMIYSLYICVKALFFSVVMLCLGEIALTFPLGYGWIDELERSGAE